MKTSLVIIGLMAICVVLLGCETVYFYQKEQVPISTPIYEKRNKPITETYYVTEKEAYETTDMVTESFEVPPIISGDNLVLALTRLAGVSREEGERIQTSLDIGFSALNEVEPDLNISLVPRVRLLMKLTEEELQGQGPAVVNVLTKGFDVNILCTGTILEATTAASKRMSVQILDLRTDEFLSEEFSGYSWEAVGYQIASSFFGTRLDTRIVPEVVVKYRDTSVPKTRMIDNWESVRVGEKKEYQTKEVYQGEKNVFSGKVLLLDMAVAVVTGMAGAALVSPDVNTTETVIAGIGIGVSSAALFNLAFNHFIHTRTVVR